MIVEFSRGALRQIDLILTGIGQESPQGKARLEARIKEAAQTIGDHPQIGSPTNRPDVRRVVLNPFPYILVYRLTRGRIIVQRVHHGARRV